MEQCAWLAREWTRTAWTTYGEISKTTGVHVSKVNMAIRAFHDEKHILVNEPFSAYWYDVKKIVKAYKEAGGQFDKPPPSKKKLGPWSAREHEARQEHAWLLRAEGESFNDIGKRLGVKNQQARIMVKKFGRRMSRAKRVTRFTIYTNKENNNGTQREEA